MEGQPVFELAADISAPPGLLPGTPYHAVLVPLRVRAREGLGECFRDLEGELDRALPVSASMKMAPPEAAEDGWLLAHRILYWTNRLQGEARLPLFHDGKVARAASGDGVYGLLVPTHPLVQPATRRAVQWLLRAFNSAAAGERAAASLRGLGELQQLLAAKAGRSSNMPRLLAAAHRMSLPWQRLSERLYAFGQGARMRWMDSTYTEATPQIAARVARDKVESAMVLRKAGLPAPTHLLVDSADAASAAAAKLGYPVVVKPANLDGGAGVAAHLESAQEVREAFHAAREKSRRILVEKHFEGRDYRLTVFNGKLLWAIERQPGGVTGDGRQTVRQLLDQANADPRRGDSPLATLKKIDFDDEARVVLAKQGLAPGSIPQAGQWVPLRRASNVARGGMPVAVTSEVHPDNAALAVRAASLLRLDLAGIDLLIPDIRQSWAETGALICEVNAQPQLGQLTAAHLYEPLLRALVPANGRIPIAVVLDPPDPAALGRAVVERLAASGCVAAWAASSGAGLHGETLSTSPLGAFEAGQLLVLERRAEAAVLVLDSAAATQSGLAFDRFDVLLVAHGAGAPARRMARLLASICDGPVGCAPSALPSPQSRDAVAVLPEDSAQWLAGELLAARARHASA